jgi:hypothetical protein
MSGSRRWAVLASVLAVVVCWGVLGCGAKADQTDKSVTTAPAVTKTAPPTPPTPAVEKPAEVPAKPAKPGAPEPAVIKMCAKAPELNGDLADAAWKDAGLKGLWIESATGNAAKMAPKVCVTYDDKNLYIAFYNPEPKMKDVIANCTDRDGNVWEDDSNEIFLDPSSGKKDYFQFIVNSKNVLYDGKGKDGSWNSNAKSVVKKLADAWIVEISIPLADLDVGGSLKGTTWTGNFCRNRRTEGEGQNMSWCDTGESFHNPDAFGKMKFE